VHDVLVRHVGVREDDLVDLLLDDDLLQLSLRPDRDPARIERAGERRRVDAVLDVRKLRRGERDDAELAAPAVDDVEVVEVAAGGAGDENPRPLHAESVCTPSGRTPR